MDLSPQFYSSYLKITKLNLYYYFLYPINMLIFGENCRFPAISDDFYG